MHKHKHDKTQPYMHTEWSQPTPCCQPGGAGWDYGDAPSGRGYSGPAVKGEALLL